MPGRRRSRDGRPPPDAARASERGGWNDVDARKEEPCMIDVQPDPGAEPLSSPERAKDAAEAGVTGDDGTQTSGDTHLPASESDALSRKERERADPARKVTALPPD
jgi:hypothetical protein